MNRLYILLPVLFSLLSLYLGAVGVPDSIPAPLASSSDHGTDPLPVPSWSSLEELRAELNLVNLQIEQARIVDNDIDFRKHFYLLSRKIQLQEQLEILEGLYELDLTKKRYKKGIDLIKMIYEKILGLDHHFSSIHTFQNVTALSNPNTYPEFQKSRELLQEKLKKENSLKLPALLETNPYLSTTFSVVASLIGGGAPSPNRPS